MFGGTLPCLLNWRISISKCVGTSAMPAATSAVQYHYDTSVQHQCDAARYQCNTIMIQVQHQCDAVPGKSSRFLILHILDVRTLSHRHHGANFETTIFKFWCYFRQIRPKRAIPHPTIQNMILKGDRIFWRWSIPLRSISDDMM